MPVVEGVTRRASRLAEAADRGLAGAQASMAIWLSPPQALCRALLRRLFNLKLE